jgi:ABC-type glutathione transport system ATPase component
VQDVASEMLDREGHHDELRKNEFWAVNDVSFELKRGECLGLIGPNGAGKSTLLKMLNGLVKPDKGRITMRGRVGALIELGAGFNPILTARVQRTPSTISAGLRLDDPVPEELMGSTTNFTPSAVQTRRGNLEILTLDELLDRRTLCAI